MNQIEIEISGRVQGVFLRRTLSNVANALNLNGYVENRNDGTVYLLAQGDRSKLGELVKWCQKGNMFSKIDGLSYKFSKGKQEYTEFETREDKNLIADRIAAIKNLGKRIIAEPVKVKVPQHIVIIPDGNRRWAREQGWKPWVGHQRAASKENLLRIFEEGAKLGVTYVTFWGFSTENWSRDQREIQAIFAILHDYFKDFLEACQKRQIRFRHIGRKDRLPKELLARIEDLEKGTAEFKRFNVQLALDYGGKDELIRAVQKINVMNPENNEIDEAMIRAHLDSDPDVPDPDLIIRTSGEHRTSGVLLSQADYAELYFTDVYFPDFTAEHLRLAVLDYSYRTRRFGGTAEEDIANINLDALSEPPKP